MNAGAVALFPLLPLIGAMLLTGCESMAVTAFGVGASTGVSHTLNGIAYRTFTAPRGRVKVATVNAMARMGFKAQGERTRGANANGETLLAKANDRDIEVELESLSTASTRMRAVVKQGLFYDSATAVEIILQTEAALAHPTT